MRIVEKAQLMSPPEIDRTLQRLVTKSWKKAGGQSIWRSSAFGGAASRGAEDCICDARI